MLNNQNNSFVDFLIQIVLNVLIVQEFDLDLLINFHNHYLILKIL